MVLQNSHRQAKFHFSSQFDLNHHNSNETKLSGFLDNKKIRYFEYLISQQVEVPEGAQE